MQFTRLTTLAAAVSTAVAQYKGFNYGSTNPDGSAKSYSDFRTEFETARNLAGGANSFTSARLYTMIQAGTPNSPISAIQAAIDTDTTLLLGLWASAGQDAFDNELSAMAQAIQNYGSAFSDRVVGISVGSEDLYRITPTGIANMAGIGAGPDILTRYVGEVRNVIAGTTLASKPVGHVDTWTAYVNGSNSGLISAVDFLGVDAYPYFETTLANSIDNGKSQFFAAYQATVNVAQGKPVWVTETGWPVSGPQSNLAVPSVANAKTYYDEVGCTLFDTTNTWWYTLYDGTPAPSFGITGSTLTTQPLFDLTCPAGATGVSAAVEDSSEDSDGQVVASAASATAIYEGTRPDATIVISNTLPYRPTNAGQPVTQIGDGQIQAPTGQPVTQIGDGQIQAPSGTDSGNYQPVTQIGDGQVQAPTGQAVSQIGDGQIQAPAGGQPVTQIGDGQVQAPTGQAVSQIGDGQIQAPAGGQPVTQIGDGQVQAPTGQPVTQIGDGQVQAPAGGQPVTQIGDGQVQAPTGAITATSVINATPFAPGAAGQPVTQIGDGQIQAPTGKPVTQIGDGQVQAPTATVEIPATPFAPGPVGQPVTQIGDGQVQAPTGKPVTQIGDGQIQAPTQNAQTVAIGTAPLAPGPVGQPVTQIGDGQVQAPTGKPVTQIGDGQVQAPTGAITATSTIDATPFAPGAAGQPVTQIGDGQVQAPTGKPVTQIGDGQVQAPTGKPVTQIGDGQIQAPTGQPVTQIGDGQIQAPTGKPVSQIGDGQVQVGTTLATVVASGKAGSATATGYGYASPSNAPKSCSTELTGSWEFPHLIVPVNKDEPSKPYGTSFNGEFNDKVSSCFNFDIPASYAGKTCSLIFLFPTQDQLTTSSYQFSGQGGLDIYELESPVTQQTSYSTVPKGMKLGHIEDVKPGNSYVVASHACAAGKTLSFEFESTGSLDMTYFQDWNPSPIGAYITTCD